MSSFFKPQPWISPLITTVLISSSFLGIVYLQWTKAIETKSNHQNLNSYHESESQAKTELTWFNKIPNLGFNNLLANWIYLKFIQYFGDTNAREKLGYALSSQYFQSLVNRDPRFIDAILKLDTATSIFDGEPQVSVSLLNQSVESIPSSFRSPSTPAFYLWIYKGIDELLFLGQPQAAERSYRQAIELAKKTPDKEGKINLELINRLQQTSDFLAKKPDSKIPQIGAWSMILSNSPDQSSQKRAITEIQKLGGQVYVTPEGYLQVRVPSRIK